MALHDVPLVQIFALNACHAWGEGLSVAGVSYEDQDMHAALARIVAAKPLTSEAMIPWQASPSI